MDNQNLPAVQEQQPQPFGRMLAASGGINAGSIAIEQERAVAEAQGQLTLAKRFPRSMAAAMTEFMDTCASPEFAATAFYSVPNRGSGPSIRFAEEAARCYGNFQYGHRELSRSEGKSEIEVFAWDMQNNNYSKRQITVMHVRDTKDGPRPLRDQADIDNRIANVASKQMRGRILALLPKHLVAAGQEACKRTLAGGNETPLRERILKMAQAFGRFGVTDGHLAAYLGHPVDQTTLDELADLMGIYNAIKEGAKASEYFSLEQQQAAVAAETTSAAITNRGKAAVARQKSADPQPDATVNNSNPPKTVAKPARDNPASVTQNGPQGAAQGDSDPSEGASDAGDDDVF